MTSTQLREKLREEIRGFPDSRLQEVFDFIHFFRLGVEKEAPPTAPDVMRFAGAWEDMQDFEAFEADLRRRRRAALRRGGTMAPVLIDTDILSRFFRRDLKVVARFSACCLESCSKIGRFRKHLSP